MNVEHGAVLLCEKGSSGFRLSAKLKRSQDLKSSEGLGGNRVKDSSSTPHTSELPHKDSSQQDPSLWH